ncbi:RHS repeat-associated core domain-containing protein [Kitasatospora sp. NPDC056731]|uniref:RHS repeat-associated core domain-containing protein n=1 Tax=Kitasatospora sp. NPDC056731 TaxID=3155422 RepID=UPI00341CE693
MSSPSFFTQGGNFASAVSGGVDPRTGLFTAGITLGHLVGNRNLGPALPLELSYSPLSQANYGFGQGVSLGLTVYDKDAGRLSLASGDQYKTREVPDKKRVELSQNPLVTVSMTMDDSSYKIVHKSGDVEILTGPKDGYPLKVPTVLLTPAGRRLDLEWQHKGQQPYLTKVSDENKDVLLTADYTDQSRPVIKVLPGQDEAFNVNLKFTDDRLTEVSHTDPYGKELLKWDLVYSVVGKDGAWGMWLTAVTLPGGMTESVVYSDDGHQFPTTAPPELKPLPYVTMFRQDPGAGQPVVKSTYTYSDYNFVGGQSGVAWDPGSDNLYAIEDSGYTYYSVESRACAGQTTEVKRTYDKFHLLVEEYAHQNGYSTTTRTVYNVVPGASIDKQPANFQLPKTRTVTWGKPDPQHPGTSKTRSETTETVFDTQGNPVSRTDPDKTITTWAFYPATGSEDKDHKDCPPDPNGFTRFLKSVTRTPPDTGEFKAPVYATTYTYEAASTKDTRVPKVVLKSKESHQGDGTLLDETTYSHETTDAKEFGRVTGTVETEYPDGAKGTSYAATHTFTFKVDGDALLQSHTLTADDKVRKLRVTRSQTRSRFTGRLRAVTDPQGSKAEMTYDHLGRLVKRTVNPDTAHVATQTHQYALGPGGKGFVVTSTDARGNQVRDTLDGAGRSVATERLDIDATKPDWFTLRTAGYDEQGRAATATAFDLTRDGTTAKLGQTVTYDDWGQPLTTENTDGPTSLTRVDPVDQTVTTQALKSTTVATGTQVTTHDLRLRPLSVERFERGSAHTPRGKRTMEYDGWGRLRRATDELGHVTLHDYDVRGRLTLTTLPDGTKISRTYAPFSAQPLATGVSVDGTAYGTQTFDALGRRTSTTAGRRTWSYRYAQDADPRPARAQAPDGQASTYQYAIELGNALTEVKAGTITQAFTRDPGTGALTEAVEGAVTRTRDYYPSGLVKADTTKTDTKTLTTKAAYTVAGLEHSYTAVDGAVQKTTRDEYGRTEALVDGDGTQAVVDYDDIGRVSGWTATDTTGHKLTTELALDDFGREAKRTITDGNKNSWTLTQEWNDNDTLARRTLTHSGSTTPLRDEKYTYDKRNRLTAYTCQGTAPPKDHRGNAVTAQTFTYDAYANITTCQTAFSSGSDTATYHFSADDPCQLTRVEHTHHDYPSATLAYDKAGRLTTDDTGRTLTYDALGRLRTAGTTGATSTYGYDPLDRLLTQTTGTATSVLSYRNGTLAAVTENSTSTRLLQLAWACAAQHRTDDTRLLGTDAQRTVLLATGSKTPEEYAYTPYGDQPPKAGASVLGYTGERTDPDTGWLHLGNGYRPYHPGLMRFTAPDSLSPFGPGGINPYAYCAGDPINHTDPTGHLSWGAWLGIGLGILGLAAAAFTGGASIVAAGGLIAALESASATSLVFGALAATADITAIAGGALEKASPKASSILGWVSLGTGLAGLGSLASLGRATEGIEIATEAATAAEMSTGIEGSTFRERFPYAHLGENTFGAPDHEYPLPAGRTHTTGGPHRMPEGPEWNPLKNKLQGSVDWLNGRYNDQRLAPEFGFGRNRNMRMLAGLQMNDENKTIFMGSSGPLTGNTRLTGISQLVDTNKFWHMEYPQGLMDARNTVGDVSDYKWGCAEVDCIEQAWKAGYRDFAGARSMAAMPTGQAGSLRPRWVEPCHGDKYLLGYFGILW